MLPVMRTTAPPAVCLSRTCARYRAEQKWRIAGSVQTFTAPVDGIYSMELWGSDGGRYGTHAPGKGGYTLIYIHVDGTTILYMFVGGSGSPVKGNSVSGGWNGGGYTKTCLAGPHSGSGGGMTHVSYTNNLAEANPDPNTPGTWDPEGTIAVAGGGGGAGVEADGVGHGGGTATSSIKNNRSGNAIISGSTQTSGYAQGVGQSCANSSGGGGGWFGGRSAGFTKQVNGGLCGVPGVGGTGYITEAGMQTSYSHLSLMLNGDAGNKPENPGSYNHGWIRVALVEAD